MKVYTTQGKPPSGDAPKASQKNLIRLFIPCRFGTLPVALAGLLKSVNDGLIPRIYIQLTHTGETTALIAMQDFTSRSRALLGLTNVRFSARSVKRGRTLISASYSSGTSKSAPVLPLAG
jgi:hypothetical protein